MLLVWFYEMPCQNDEVKLCNQSITGMWLSAQMEAIIGTYWGDRNTRTYVVRPNYRPIWITSKWSNGFQGSPIYCHKIMINGVARVQMIQFGKTSRNILIIHMSVLQFNDNQLLSEYTYFYCFEIYEVIKICVCFLVHCIHGLIYVLVHLSLWMLHM